MIIQRLILILILSLVAGCGTNPPAQPTTEPTETPKPETSEDETSDSDKSPGEVLFNQFIEEVSFSCNTCHYPDSDDRLLGPGLLSIEERFETYDIEVDSLESYIKQSIQDPGAFIVPNESPYPVNIMPRTYGDIFTDEELDMLIDFILST